MKEELKEAIKEWHSKRFAHDFGLVALSNGLYAPPRGDQCVLCENAQWSCNTGAHLKTTEHIALKRGIPFKLLRRAIQDLDFKASEFGWKKLVYTENSYLRSDWNDFPWGPGETVEAYCGMCEDGPEVDCDCGFYFYWSPFRAISHYSGDVVVKIKVGGAVVECTLGGRAQYARIVGIYEKDGSREAVEMAELYDVPLIDVVSDEELGDYYV